jgi:hypothetical protein
MENQQEVFLKIAFLVPVMVNLFQNVSQAFESLSMMQT